VLSVETIKKLANYMAKWKFARDAIDDHADLSEIKENPTVKNYMGIFLMCFSYILGFPAIGLLGALSIYWREPKLIMIGGPLLFIIAHLVFMAGMVLAGGKYLRVFFRLATRVALEKFIEK
jgi:hypothetical protein